MAEARSIDANIEDPGKDRCVPHLHIARAMARFFFVA